VHRISGPVKGKAGRRIRFVDERLELGVVDLLAERVSDHPYARGRASRRADALTDDLATARARDGFLRDGVVPAKFGLLIRDRCNLIGQRCNVVGAPKDPRPELSCGSDDCLLSTRPRGGCVSLPPFA
jgi:hypothetical protein